MQKLDNIWQEQYSRKDLKNKKIKPTKPFTVEEVKDMIKQMANTSPGTWLLSQNAEVIAT